jgi:hypothetical protein
MTDGLIDQTSAASRTILALIGFTIAVCGWAYLIMSAE